MVIERSVSMQFVIKCFILLLLIGSLSPHAHAQQPADPNIVINPKLFEGLDYRMVGPYRGGRVTTVTGVPGDPTMLYFGAVGGGVWQSDTYGRKWENITDGQMAVGSIGDIAVAASDPKIIYVGTGSASVRSNVSTGRGMYKSTDAGKTWTFSGLKEAGQIGEVVVHPMNPDLVYVAATGHIFGPNSERGVFRSKDGGNTWEHVLAHSDTVGAVDMVMNPENPNELYAALWRAERKPWTIISGGTEGGIYKTRDGGDTWTKLTIGLPEGLIGKIGLALSPTNPNRLYALVEAPDDQGGLYRSDNAGRSFRFINGQQSLTFRPFYYIYMTPDPQDENTVYVNNEGFFKSTDAGSTFVRIRVPHGDNHDLWIHPDDPSFLFQANDGGVNVSLNGGKTWSTQTNQATAELYHVVVDNQFPYWLYGEQQDNSTIMVPSLPPTAGRPLNPKSFWRRVAGCETGPIAVHPLDPNIVYGNCKGRFSRYNHRTGQEQHYWVYPHFNYGHQASEMPYRFQRTSPIEISPHNPNVIYHASQYLHKTTDEGKTWETISPDLTANESDKQGYSGGPITRDITGEEIYSTIYQVRESLHEEGVIWVGSNDGPFHITRDGGNSWTDITPPDLPSGGRVQTIDPSPHQPGKAYYAVYRYMLDDWQPYIYKTEDYGTTWTVLTTGQNGIPADQPTRTVREDPDREGLLYAGTEFGMFISFDDGAHWQSLQFDLPATPVTDIRVHRKDLILSTMGRSFWIMDDLTPLHQLHDQLAANEIHLFKPRDTFRMRWSQTISIDNGAAPEYPPFGALIHYYLPEDTDGEIKMDILDADHIAVLTYASDSTDTDIRPAGMLRLPSKAGMHRIAWNLRYPGPIALEEGKSGGQGPMAVPGTYQVRLSIGEWTHAQSFELVMDPRIAADNVTMADLREQFGLNTRIRDRISELRLAVRKIRSVNESLDNVREEGGTSAERAARISQELAKIEEALIQTRKGKVGANLKPMLMRQLTYLYGMITRADQKPGRDAHQRLQDIEVILERHLSDLKNVLDSDLPVL
jgi:photosystem II stability/assembly factor-like uncharacterized protein